MKNLTGEIPDLRAIQNLTFLDASDNALSGGFSAGKLPASLVEISLRSNRLEGEIPAAAVSALPAFQVMDLSHNGFWGTVPGTAFEHPCLEQLTLAYGRFESVQGPWDGGLGSQLIALDLGPNRLEGLLPAFLGSMPRLSALSLEDNRFTGMLPTQYAIRAVGGGGAAPFARLNLSENYLFGPIPSPMGGTEGRERDGEFGGQLFVSVPDRVFLLRGGKAEAARHLPGVQSGDTVRHASSED